MLTEACHFQKIRSAVTSRRIDIMTSAVVASSVDTSLAVAERKGFKLAVIGRTCALVPIAVFYLAVYRYPNNVYVAGAILVAAAIGLAPVRMQGGRHERWARYALFAFDAAALSAMLALAPISSGGDIPQNLVFHLSRGQYYFIVVAIAMLALSPSLVIWTGLWSVAGLAAATIYIMSGMDRVVGFGDLPMGPSREAFLSVALDPHFLSVPVRVGECVKLALVTGVAALAVYRARAVVYAHAHVEIERGRIRELFGRYVPSQVVEQLINAGQLAPQSRHASLLIADIQGFTQIAESSKPPQVIAMMNSYLGAASGVIEAHGGVTINCVGDSLLAAFNAPLPSENHATQAVRAAQALLRLVSATHFEGRLVRLRIGIATGPVAAGTVGGSDRQAYTLYGDTVNMAQRLEQLNKEFDTQCLICGQTYVAAVASCVDAISKGQIQLRGRVSTTEVFAL
jgi:class 3 adenylate cyclase